MSTTVRIRPSRRARAAGAFLAAVTTLAASLVVPTGAIAETAGTAPAPPTRLGTPVLSVRRAPDFLTGAVADARLRRAVDEVTAKVPDTSCLAISDGDRPLVSIRGTTPVIPASLQKVLTGTALLDRLGSDTTLSTRVVAASKPDNGVVNGDVWLVGAGDPLLTTGGYQQAFEDQGQVWLDFTKLADAVQQAGITRITGNLVGDDSRFDQERYFKGWPTRYQRQDQVGPLSALLVNDGVTGYSTSPDKPTGTRRPGDPPVLAAETLATLLEARGVVLGGNPSAGKAPDKVVELASLPSLPLRDVVGEMLADSDNTTAEVLLKELAVRSGTTPGTTEAGAQQVFQALEKRNLPLDGVVLHDGSGLDEDNRVTCNLLMGLLGQLGPDSDVAKGFAVSSRKGTLRKRLIGTPAEGKVLGKTGTLNTVFSLAGFTTDAEGKPLTFSIILNGTIPNGAALLDSLAVAMAQYPQRPDPVAIAPEPVQQ